MNKIKYHAGLFFLMCLLLSSKNLLAQPCPTVNVSVGNSGSVSFTAVSTLSNATASYTWNFGNNTTSVSLSPYTNVTYTANGFYIALLTYSTTSPSWSCSVTQTINISNVCSLTFSNTLPNPMNICNGTATVTSTGMCSPVSYTWFSGATPIGTGSTVPGLCKGTVYNVIASAGPGTNCCQTSSGTIAVPNTTCGLTASFSAQPVVNSYSVSFQNVSIPNGPGMVYTWYWGDGNSAVSANTFTGHVYSIPGAYTPTLVAVNTLTPCTDAIAKSVVVCTLNASFITSPGSNGAYSFTSTSTGTVAGTTYTWSYGPPGATSNGALGSWTYAASGSYSVKLVASNNFSVSCRDSSTTGITVNVPAPCNLSASFSASVINPTLGMVNFINTTTGTISTTSYSWNFGAGQTSGVANPGPITYSANGVYTVMLTVINTSLCTSTYTQAVVITGIAVPCNLDAGFTHLVGASGLVNFSSTSTGTNNLTDYYWDFGDGIYGFTNAPTHTYLYSGAYNVKLVIKDPAAPTTCRDSIVWSVNVTGLSCVANANFNLSLSGTTQYSIATPIYPWNVISATWDWGDGSSSNLLYTSHTYSAAGIYTICLTVTVNCGATAMTCASGQNMAFVNILPPALVTSIATNETNNVEYTIYPNPNNGEFNLNVTGLKPGPINITIYNVVGEMVYETGTEIVNNEFAKEIKLDQASKGVYFIKINTDHKVFGRKVIITGF